MAIKQCEKERMRRRGVKPQDMEREIMMLKEARGFLNFFHGTCCVVVTSFAFYVSGGCRMVLVQSSYRPIT